MVRRILLGIVSLSILATSNATPVLAARASKSSSTPTRAASTPKPTAMSGDVRAILQRMGDRYRDLDSYHLEGSVKIEITTDGGNQTMDAPFVFAAARPGRLRDELRHPQGGSLVVSDGRQIWSYLAAMGQFTRKPADGDTTLPFGMLASQLFAMYRDLAAADSGARVVREEKLEYEGASRPCWVIEARIGVPNPADPPRTFWVDQERLVVLQQEASVALPNTRTPARQTETLRFTRVSLNEPVPNHLFAFGRRRARARWPISGPVRSTPTSVARRPATSPSPICAAASTLSARSAARW